MTGNLKQIMDMAMVISVEMIALDGVHVVAVA